MFRICIPRHIVVDLFSFHAFDGSRHSLRFAVVLRRLLCIRRDDRRHFDDRPYVNKVVGTAVLPFGEHLVFQGDNGRVFPCLRRKESPGNDIVIAFRNGRILPISVIEHTACACERGMSDLLHLAHRHAVRISVVEIAAVYCRIADLVNARLVGGEFPIRDLRPGRLAFPAFAEIGIFYFERSSRRHAVFERIRGIAHGVFAVRDRLLAVCHIPYDDFIIHADPIGCCRVDRESGKIVRRASHRDLFEANIRAVVFGVCLIHIIGTKGDRKAVFLHPRKLFKAVCLCFIVKCICSVKACDDDLLGVRSVVVPAHHADVEDISRPRKFDVRIFRIAVRAVHRDRRPRIQRVARIYDNVGIEDPGAAVCAVYTPADLIIILHISKISR